jgi:predicted amidohydrolase
MTLRIAAVQLNSQDELGPNLERSRALVAAAARAGARVVLLPENFAYVGPEEGKRRLAEDLAEAGPIVRSLGAWAREHDVWLIAGGLPEKSGDADRPFNTCALFAPTGEIRARYRKIHLFDVDLRDGIDYRESAATTPGSEPVVADVEGVRLGLSVCYDLRFPELYRALGALGAQAVVVPAAFTLVTGKDHWHVLLRARAIENQCYVVAAAQWGKHGKRVTYGKSCVVDPWGEIVAQVSEGEGFACAELDVGYLESVRARLPALRHKRLG